MAPYSIYAAGAAIHKDIRCKPCIGFLAAISQLRSKLLLTNQGLSVPKGVLLIQHGTNLMRSKLLIAWLITLQAATRRGVLKHDKHSTNAVL